MYALVMKCVTLTKSTKSSGIGRTYWDPFDTTEKVHVVLGDTLNEVFIKAAKNTIFIAGVEEEQRKYLPQFEILRSLPVLPDNTNIDIVNRIKETASVMKHEYERLLLVRRRDELKEKMNQLEVDKKKLDKKIAFFNVEKGL